MKLQVVFTSAVETQKKDVNIRNPNATIANLRAAIAVHFKIDPHRFRMIHSLAAMDDEAVLLSASGIRDGDVITLVAKRDREDAAAAVVEIAPTAPNASEGGAPQAAPGGPPAAVQDVSRASNASSSLSIGQIVEALALASARSSIAETAGPGSTRSTGVASTVAAGRIPSIRSTVASNRSTRNRHTAPHGIDPEPISLDFARGHEDEDENDDEEDWEDEEGSFDDEGDDEEDDDEEDPEMAEQQELVQLLLEAPNVLELRDQFLHAPEAMLTQIRDTNPRLFQLIASNSQFFLELVQNEDLLATLREEAEGDAHYLYEEGEVEEDSEDEAQSEMISNMLINALQQQAASRGGAGRLAGENAAPLRDGAGAGGSSSNPPSLLPSGRSTRSSHPNRHDSSTSLRRNRGGAGGSTSSSTAQPLGGAAMVVPENISPEDNEKIESLIQLGFTREQCTAAFFRCNRSVERAANMLFENLPTI